MTKPPAEVVLPGADADRDRVLMGLLFVLNLGSLLTTVLGARELLPSPMAEILGFSIQAMLFTMLSGFAGEHAPLRKWLVVTVFASACVYCSFFAYYEQLGRAGDEERLRARAQERHAELVQAVFAEGSNAGERLRREAAALERQAEDEARRGSTTGQSGYGPRAKEMRAAANAAALRAEQHLAIVEPLEPLFAFDAAALAPREVFERDLAAWQAAPAEWRGGFPKPRYEDYVDEAAQVAFLAPLQRVRQGDAVASVSLALAGAVDGMAILLGTAIERRRRRPVAQRVAGLVRDVKAGYSRVRDALAAGEHEHDAVTLHVADPVQFLTVFYEAIHPETGHIEFDGLLRRDRDTGLAARILLDRLLSRGWVVRREGEFRTDEGRYHAITAWLGAQIARARREGATGELALELPWSAE